MGSSHGPRNVSSLFGTVARPIQVIANKVNTVLNLEKIPGVNKKKPHK
jgi:hypothetical protein